MASNSSENLKKYIEKLLKMGHTVKSITTKSGNKMLAFFEQKTNKFARLLPASAKLSKTISENGKIVSSLIEEKIISNDSGRTA